MVDVAGDSAGAALQVIRLHDLRHTHATLLLAKGVPVKVVSERLGHASPVIIPQVYAHGLVVCRSHLRGCRVRGASRLLRTCRRSLVS